MENNVEVKSRFMQERQNFLLKYQNRNNGNIIVNPIGNKPNTTTGGTSNNFGLDIPMETEDDRIK